MILISKQLIVMVDRVRAHRAARTIREGHAPERKLLEALARVAQAKGAPRWAKAAMDGLREFEVVDAR